MLAVSGGRKYIEGLRNVMEHVRDLYELSTLRGCFRSRMSVRNL